MTGDSKLLTNTLFKLLNPYFLLCGFLFKTVFLAPFLLLVSLCFPLSEFMSGGSVYDFMHKQKGIFKFPALLKVAIDVSKGMNYLHQNNIIHRDLKAANLLMDENEVRTHFLALITYFQ